MPPLLADFIYNRVCKLKCEKSLTLPLYLFFIFFFLLISVLSLWHNNTPSIIDTVSSHCLSQREHITIVRSHASIFFCCIPIRSQQQTGGLLLIITRRSCFKKLQLTRAEIPFALKPTSLLIVSTTSNNLHPSDKQYKVHSAIIFLAYGLKVQLSNPKIT